MSAVGSLRPGCSWIVQNCEMRTGVWHGIMEAGKPDNPSAFPHSSFPLSLFPGGSTPAAGGHAAGRTSPLSGPRGRASHAAAYRPMRAFHIYPRLPTGGDMAVRSTAQVQLLRAAASNKIKPDRKVVSPPWQKESIRSGLPRMGLHFWGAGRGTA